MLVFGQDEVPAIYCCHTGLRQKLETVIYKHLGWRGGWVGLPDVRSVERRTGTTQERPVDRFVPADLRHSRESNENELANYPEPPARGA